MRRNLLITTIVAGVLAIAALSSHAEGDRAAQKLTHPDRCDAKAGTGYVLVTFNISPEGKAIDLSIIESCPSEIFNEQTLKAVREHDFQPTG
jgi:TonB family protein